VNSVSRPSLQAGASTQAESSASAADKLYRRRVLPAYAATVLVSVGVLLRLLIAVLPGNRLNAPWGGLGDAPAYALLAHNIAAGKGYAYAGFPTAYRAPVYPLFLAAAMKVFGAHAFQAVRAIQLLMGFAVVYLCASIAERLFGKRAKIPALIIALFFPTLAMMTGDILTEATATLFSALCLYLLVVFLQRPSWKLLSALSFCVGIATLTRFNMALLGIVLLAAVLFQQSALPRWRAAALTVCLSAAVISPWIVRNYSAFHGRLLLSTESGPTAVGGVLAPEGRALPGDSEHFRKALGWVPPADVETNAASRSQLGSEAVLNSAAWKVAFKLWRQTGWGLVPLNFKKTGYFWLSTDQLLSTGSFRPALRIARAGAVLWYWILLAFGIAGWFLLRSRSPRVAKLFLFYAVLVTVMHFPFQMNTRYRMPLVDPLLAALGGAAVLALIEKSSGKRVESARESG
jgi:4-amino-4-deoxy-L-arabinose transferase-like glycosyltransferase